ncbi:MAG: hypothetical protein WA830_13505 [Candidatus Sulfotelmatobacter sp.]
MTAAKAALAPTPLHVLLVGNKEEDFYLIREILQRTHNVLAADLDHAHSLEEAKTMLREKSYGLVLFEHETGDAEEIGDDIGFTFTRGEGLGAVRVDSLQIEQILMNLASNARDAMPQGGHLRIETSPVRLDDDYLHRKPSFHGGVMPSSP